MAAALISFTGLTTPPLAAGRGATTKIIMTIGASIPSGTERSRSD